MRHQQGVPFALGLHAWCSRHGLGVHAGSDLLVEVRIWEFVYMLKKMCQFAAEVPMHCCETLCVNV